MGEWNKSSDFSDFDVFSELVEFDDVMKRCQGIAGLTRAVDWAGGQGVLNLNTDLIVFFCLKNL